MKFLHLTFLALLLSAMCAGIFFSQYESSPKLVGGGILENLRELTVLSQGQQDLSLVLSCNQDRTCPRLSSYPELPLDGEAVESLSRVIASLNEFEQKPFTKNKAQFGFDASSRGFSLFSDEGRVSFSIGKENALLGGYYALSKTLPESFIVLPKSFVNTLFTLEKTLPEKNLYSEELKGLRSITLTSYKDVSVLLRHSDEGWMVGERRADERFVRELVDGLQALEFTDVLPSSSPLIEGKVFFAEVALIASTNGGSTDRTFSLTFYRKHKLVRSESGERKEISQYFVKKGEYSYLFRLKQLPRMMANIQVEQYLQGDEGPLPENAEK